MAKAIIAPSMLSADFARLAEEAHKIIADGADWLHMDVMDGLASLPVTYFNAITFVLKSHNFSCGRYIPFQHLWLTNFFIRRHFVDNLTIGAPVIKSLRKHVPSAFLDCHLMVSHPEKWVDDFHKAGASQITFHIETTPEPTALAARIKSLGMKAGLALRPSTPLESILPFLHSFDMILVMTVEPGFGGQSFMADQMTKVQEIRRLKPELDIQVDGGLSPKTIDVAAAAGANVIVAGSAVFGDANPANVIRVLRESVEKHQTR